MQGGIFIDSIITTCDDMPREYFIYSIIVDFNIHFPLTALLALLERVLERRRIFASPQFASARGAKRAWSAHLLHLVRPLASTHFLPVLASSTKTSTQYFCLNCRMKRGSQSSDAMPKSLQHRMRALDLAPSEAVAMPFGSKYSCSPRAVEMYLQVRRCKRINVVCECDKFPRCIFLPSVADEDPLA